MIAGGITLAMIISIVAMRWSIGILQSLSETQALNHQLVANMLMLRRNEKDFLLRSDIKYLDKFNKNYALMQENISQLGDLIEENGIVADNYSSLKTIIKSYQNYFHQLVALSKQIGLDPKSGLRGTLRSSVHQAESVFKEVKNYQLFKDMLMLRRNEKDFLMRKDTKYLDKFNKNYLIFVADINASSLSAEQQTNLLEDVKKYQSDFMQLAKLAEQKGFGPTVGILGEMRETIHKSESILEQLHEVVEKATNNSGAKIRQINLILSLVISAIVITFTILLAQTITRSLLSFVSTLKQICQTGDLSLRVDESGNDEISGVGHTLNEMLATFQEIIQRLHKACDDLGQYSQQFLNIRDDTFDSVKKQQMETEQVLIAMTQMSASAQNIAGNTTCTAEAAEQANIVTREGKVLLDKAIGSTNELVVVINNANQVIQQLGEDSNSIGGILDVIRGIAEQTNLLALNAAIEAARAGEQGRGFAVVADEVRTLAQKTQDSISEIETMIISLQNGSTKAIQAITQGKEGVSNNVEQVSGSGRSLTSIVKELNSINEMSQENASATEKQSIVAEEVNNNVLKIKNLSSQIVDNIELLKQSSDLISGLSSNMEVLIKRFKA